MQIIRMRILPTIAAGLDRYAMYPDGAGQAQSRNIKFARWFGKEVLLGTLEARFV